MNATAEPGLRYTPLRELWNSEGLRWVFIVKTVIAALLALWIGFRLGIPSARSAMITVFIVAQPQSGLVVAKSFYRVIGTLVGLVVTIALVQGFAQTRDLFLGAIAVWIGVCVAGSAYFRNFQSYAFLLAGYTSCLIGFPAAEHPELTYDIALGRATAVLLGILCAGVVAEAVFPHSLSLDMVGAVRGRFRSFASFTRRVLARELDHATIQREHLRYTADVVALDAQRAAAYFENPESRVRDERLRLFNAEFMAAATAMHALHQWMERLRREQRDGVVAPVMRLYQPLLDALLADDEVPATAAEALRIVAPLRAARQHIADTAAAQGSALSGEDARDYRIACDLLLRFADALYEYAAAYAALATPRGHTSRRAPYFVPHTDGLAAALCGLRAVLALLVVSAFWISASWPEGAAAATMATVVCALFAASPSPERAAGQMRLGFLLGFALSIPFEFWLMPQLDGFVLLAAGLAPVLMFSSWLSSQPALAGIGTGFNLLFIQAIGIENSMQYEVVSTLNESIATLIGVSVASVAFSTLLPAGAPWFLARKRAALRRQLAMAAWAPLSGLSHRFESRTRDLLLQLLATPGLQAGEDRHLLATAMAVLEVGDALIELRGTLRATGLDTLRRHKMRLAARALVRAFERDDVPSRHAARHAIETARQSLLDALRETGATAEEHAELDRTLRRLHRIRRALDDPDTPAAAPNVLLTPTSGVIHAA